MILSDVKIAASKKRVPYDFDEVGVWEVKGEDGNADLGGHHYQPTLGYFQGKLEDVFNYAVHLPNFWAWGQGGDFKKVEIVPINKGDSVKFVELNQKRNNLKRELDEVEDKIANL